MGPPVALLAAAAGVSAPAPAETRPAGTAADLLDAGECSPQCLLAREPGGACVCRCGGEFHGALTGAEVRPVAEPRRRRPRRVPASPVWEDEGTDAGWDVDDAWWGDWWRKHGQWDAGWDVLDMVCPVMTATEAIGACLRERNQGAPWPVRWAQPEADGGWSVHVDVACIAPLRALTAETTAAQREFLAALAAAGRCERVQAGAAAWACGFSGEAEARIAGAVLGGLAFGNTALARESVQAIRRQAA